MNAHTICIRNIKGETTSYHPDNCLHISYGKLLMTSSLLNYPIRSVSVSCICWMVTITLSPLYPYLTTHPHFRHHSPYTHISSGISKPIEIFVSIGFGRPVVAYVTYFPSASDGTRWIPRSISSYPCGWVPRWVGSSSYHLMYWVILNCNVVVIIVLL